MLVVPERPRRLREMENYTARTDSTEPLINMPFCPDNICAEESARKEGIFHDLPAETYHAAPGVSHTMLKHMHPTPAHLQAYLQEKPEPSAAMILGSLVHSLVLEPERPLPRLAIKPAEMKFTTREGKAWRDEQQRAGKLIITEAEFKTLLGCVSAVSKHTVCREIFAHGQSEVSVFQKFFNLDNTVLRKARLDFVPDGNALVDVKTTQDASPEAFAKEIVSYRYHTQAAYYLDIWNDATERPFKQCFLFIAVEKVPPYLVAVYNLDIQAIEKGRAENHADLCTYMACAERGEWPGYAQEIVNLNLPPWAYGKKGVSL